MKKKTALLLHGRVKFTRVLEILKGHWFLQSFLLHQRKPMAILTTHNVKREERIFHVKYLSL
jgi:hypothetical protein